MKTFLNIFIFLITINSFSQDERLFEQVWYLEELIIDGISHIPPVNSEVPYVSAYFLKNSELDTWICEDNFFAILDYFGTNEFAFGYAEFLLGGCDDPLNQDYAILYESFWADATLLPIVTYNIVDNNDIRTLTINGANNDIAIYGTQILGVSSDVYDLESVYINPSITEDQFIIVSNEKTLINRIMIFDATGRKTYESEGNSRIYDVSNLSQGIYLVKILTDTGFGIKRFIKK